MSERIELLYTRLAGKVVGQKISLPWRVCFSLTAFHLCQNPTDYGYEALPIKTFKLLN